MTTATAAAAPDRTAKRVPPMGGFNGTLLLIEVKRMLRNRRTLIFTLVMPAILYIMIGATQSYGEERAGHGNVAAVIMINMAMYGAMAACTAAGASVATERALGWSRQLRLTPLSPLAYVATKIIVAMLLGAVAVGGIFAIGAVTKASMDTTTMWVACGLIAWVGALVFAAFGLLMGYLLPSDNVMQFIGPGLAIMAFLGGVFIPLEDGSTLATIAKFTPMNGVVSLAQYPMQGGTFHAYWLVNVLAWLAIFGGGAVWRFREDTARV